jgi:ribonuclease P protein component
MREAYRLQKPELLGHVTNNGASLFFIYTGKELPDFLIASDKIGVLLKNIGKELK